LVVTETGYLRYIEIRETLFGSLASGAAPWLQRRTTAALAEASEQTHPAEALAGYARVAEWLAGLGGQSNYQQATKIIARMGAIRSSLGAGAKHAAYVAEFVQRHRSKRNLIKLLTSSGSG
jgi:uncharacterized Zn finger protein